MAGLTEEDFQSIARLRPAKHDLSAEGAEALRGEIYARHGIPADTPAAEAAAMIEQMAAESGSGTSAWANPEERAAARESYARQGRTPVEVNKRWRESTELLDPRTYQYMQRYGRDADFLASVAKDEAAQGTYRSDVRPVNVDAIRAYDSSASRRTSDTGGWNPFSTASGYQRFGGFGGAMLQNVTSPDTATGSYMQASEVVPNFLRMQGSGETDTASESNRRAQAARLANNRYRLSSPHPVLDAPTGTPAPVLADRMKQLQAEVGSASVPLSDERWQRTMGSTPPGFVSDGMDFAISMADPTVVLPAAKSVGAAASVARAGTMAGRVAAATPFAKGLAMDMGVEQAAGAGLQGSMGGLPGRSHSQFYLGGGKPGEDFAFKDDAQLAEARKAGDAIYDRLKDDASIENADREAYQRLVNSGAIDPFSPQGLTPQGRVNPRSPLNRQ